MKNILLVLETTAAHLGIGFYRMTSTLGPLSVYFAAQPSKQSELLIPTLERMMRAKRIRRQDLAMVAVDEGPGSFTGVRVGVSAARAMGQVLNVPVVGVSALEAIAEGSRESAAEKTIAVSIAALPGETYFAAYRAAGHSLKVVVKPCWITNQQMQNTVQKLSSKRELLICPTQAVHPDWIARVAFRRSKRRSQTYQRVKPVYLQPSWAERRKVGSS